jgi:hypothetical protein
LKHFAREISNRLYPKYISEASFDEMFFEAAERTYEQELVRLDHKIKRQLPMRKKETGKLKAEFSLKELGLVGELREVIGQGGFMLRRAIGAVAIVLAVASAEPAAAQQMRAGLLTCDVSAGLGLIITSQKQLSCVFAPDRSDIMREDYDGSITKYGLDLGITDGGIMVWAVFSGTVAGPGFLAGDYVGASGEASVGVGVGANVLIGGSNRTVTLQPVSVSGQIGINIAVVVAALRLGLPRR